MAKNKQTTSMLSKKERGKSERFLAGNMPSLDRCIQRQKDHYILFLLEYNWNEHASQTSVNFRRKIFRVQIL